MELMDKLRKKTLSELNELKSVIDSISNTYAEQLTDYALISGNNTLNDLSEEKKVIYQKRMKYKKLSLIIQEVMIEKIDAILC